VTDRAETVLRLAAFAAGLAVLAGVAWLVGRASGIDVDDTEPAAMAHSPDPADGASGGEANGLSDTAAGIRLRLDAPALRAGVASPLTLALERDGEPLVELDRPKGEPPLHLVLVRRDLAGYVHVHPRRVGERWTVDVAVPTPGIWRAYADFEREGEKVVLGRDLLVPGELAPQALAAPRDETTVDGYDVRLSRGEDLAFAVERNGRPVELEPYLGEAAHLVAIREDDLAYLHVHSREGTQRGAAAFEAELDQAGRYALFFQFADAGRVHTATFTAVGS
jgi:hypothetical protein